MIAIDIAVNNTNLFIFITIYIIYNHSKDYNYICYYLLYL